MNPRTKVILVTTYFPPFISVASNRMEAIAKYLNSQLYDIEIITLNHSLDKRIETIENGHKILRLPNRSIFKPASFGQTNSFVKHKLKAAYNKFLALWIKNEFSAWQKEVEKELLWRINQNAGLVVISSFAPAAAHSAVLNVKKNNADFIWIADFRDSMTNPFIASSLMKTYQRIQQHVLQNAEAVSSVSLPILDEFLSQQSSVKNKLWEIRNGYDFQIPEKQEFNAVFTLAYIGTFYGARKPHYFFEALKNFMDKQENIALQLQLIGVGSAIQIPDFIRQQTLVTNKVLHEEALSYMLKADGLLLLHPQSSYKGVYTGKIFEYLASLKPIIAMVDQSDVAAQLIVECNAGFIAGFESINEIEKAIEAVFLLWKNHQTLNYNLPLIQQHHRQVQTQKFDKLITQLITEKG
jgi:glycosyltransferase involved in cell wall biosynthesis